MKERIRTLLATITAMLLPVLAFAQDPDERPQPMNDHDKAIQSWAWAALAILIVVPFVWYQIRRRQILKSGNQTHGTTYHQD